VVTKRNKQEVTHMPTMDTSEKGLETLIMKYMTGLDGLEPESDASGVEERPRVEGTGWLAGSPKDYDRAHAVDTSQLFCFLQATQPEEFKKLGLANYNDTKSIVRLKFLGRLNAEISKRGVIDVLRHGLDHGALSFDLFTELPRRAMIRRRRFSPRTDSVSPASYATVSTRRGGRWISACSSTVYRLRRSN
jgi:type I restriction enzyme R subunit